ncbi:channel protein (hemolysin III family) [Rhodobacter aestuarii]|uniref:Hemolysin III n=1 Tax=Rhodobacter aestuarii TaxID=453582 RepID=A0A1N7M1N3_9RHOB|nr:MULTISPECIES: hemolysin III family protein [Rhodobacter]PTV94784.1 channel protein (hemolysin III family) [Rhodobacter aestuarii]SIS79998.1 hemolysin III [Rhodobacter aestuarii]SOC14401.1 channel protein (hemolysin III family) [Rhodobacter sp. JA431]
MTRHQLAHSFKEHFADGVMHVLGLVFAVAAVSAMMVWAAMAGLGPKIWPLIVYAVGLIASFGFSAGYNLTLYAPARAVLRRFDHAAIYLLIAGTYTPMALIGLGGGLGIAMTATIWTLALIGMVMKLGFFHRGERFGFVLYLAMGWLGVVAIWPLLQALPVAVLILLGTGGVIYTLGTVFYTRKSLPFSRAIWHGHVLAAAATHYAAVVLIAGQ